MASEKLVMAAEVARLVDRALVLVENAGAKQALTMALAAGMAKYCDRAGIDREVFCGLLRMTPREAGRGR